jgi:hypothetical protein
MTETEEGEPTNLDRLHEAVIEATKTGELVEFEWEGTPLRVNQDFQVTPIRSEEGEFSSSETRKRGRNLRAAELATTELKNATIGSSKK